MMGSTSMGARVSICAEEESERPLPIDGVHKGWAPLDVAGPGLQPPRASLVGGSATDTGPSSASGFTNSFHVSVKRSREGMGRANGRLVAGRGSVTPPPPPASS